MFVYICVYTGPPSINCVNSETCLNDIMKSWSLMSDLRACGPVSYIVTISSGGIMMTINTNDTSYSLTGLTPDTSYIISIQPSNMAGSGQSCTETISTAPISKC